MSLPLRDRSVALLTQLCPGLPSDTLRLASHALLALAQDSGTKALSDVQNALPWLAATIDAEESSSDEVAQRLHTRQALRALSHEFVAHQLQHVAPTEITGTLIALARLDAALSALRASSPRDIRTTLLATPDLFVAALDCLAHDPANLPEIRAALGITRAESGPLQVLVALENQQFEQADCGLGVRARRFEVSAVEHLRQHGFLVAVRAALALDSCDEEALHAFPALREDPPLEHLTHALIAVRHKVLQHLQGVAPLASLNPWVSYLRSACNDLAEARDITLREATSFAHFCLHVMNFCDLMHACGSRTHDDLRRSMMDIEDEVKEFALMGQAAGFDDQRASLGPFDATRWKRLGWMAYATERVARLAGGWRAGTAPAPMGSPPRVRSEVGDYAREAMEHADSIQPGLAYFLGSTLPSVQVEGAHWLERLAPAAIVAVLNATLSAVAAHLEPGQLIRLDLSRLETWTDTPLRCQVLELWLTHATNHQAGAAATLLTGQQAGVFVAEFKPSAALEAALTLHTLGVDSAHLPHLERMIRELLGIQPDASVRPTLM